MSQKSWTLVTVALLLGVVYLYFFADFGKRRPIQITVSSRPFAPNAGPGDILPLVFGLDNDRVLNDLTIAGPISSNGVSPVLWHLHSPKGSAPVHGFLYGEVLPGMEVAGPNPPAALVPNLTYHVEVHAGRNQGGLDFVPRPAVTD